MPLSAPSDGCTFQSFVVMLDVCIDRNRVISALRQQGIESTLGTYAMHDQPAFASMGYRPGDLPNSHPSQTRTPTMPPYPELPASRIDMDVEAGRETAAQG